MRLHHLIPILALAAAPQAQAQPAAEAPRPAARQCFFPRQLSSWSEVNDTTVTIRIGVERFYRLDLTSPCPELRQTLSLGLEGHHGGSSICSDDNFDLLVRDLSGEGTRRCNVRAMTAISREDAAALNRRH